MAKTSSAQTPLASQTLATGASDLASSWLTTGYGVSGWAMVYAASQPTGGLVFYVEGASDGSGTGAGLIMAGISMVPAGTGSGNAAIVPFAFGIGSGGDWAYYRVRLTAPTGNNATVECQAMVTTGL